MRRYLYAGAACLALLAMVAAVTVTADDDNDDRDGRGRRQQNVFRARMRPGNEVPICSATGTATNIIRIDDEAQTITFALSYALEGTVTASHVHLAQPFASGGVSFFFCGGGGKPACPASPATVIGIVTPADIVGPAGQGITPATATTPGDFAEVVRAIRAGNAYANVHSNVCPGGEARGQLN
jgi:CHRD domain-containing protein